MHEMISQDLLGACGPAISSIFNNDFWTSYSPFNRWVWCSRYDNHTNQKPFSNFYYSLGIPVAKLLALQGNKYNLRIQTRDPNHPRALDLAKLPNTTLIAGRADNESDLRLAFNGVTAAFVNTNGFAIGEKAEIYWGMRMFEIAKEERSMRHYVWSNLDYALKLRDYDEKYKCGHYDEKGN